MSKILWSRFPDKLEKTVSVKKKPRNVICFIIVFTCQNTLVLDHLCLIWKQTKQMLWFQIHTSLNLKSLFIRSGSLHAAGSSLGGSGSSYSPAGVEPLGSDRTEYKPQNTLFLFNKTSTSFNFMSTSCCCVTRFSHQRAPHPVSLSSIRLIFIPDQLNDFVFKVLKHLNEHLWPDSDFTV